MASLVVAYVLWFFGGWLGLHHFYLKRDRHAFFMWSTMGGCFGLGWIRDLWRLSEYVSEANNDDGYRQKLRQKMERELRPSSGTARFAAQLIMGNALGYLVSLMIPQEYTAEGLGKHFILAVAPLASAVGVHLVANIGPQRCGWLWPVVGAYLGIPWLLYWGGNISVCPLLSAILGNWRGVQWKTYSSPPRGVCSRLTRLSVFGAVYLAMVLSAVYFNASVTIKDGEEVPLREAVHNFFKSPAWREMKDSMWRLYQFFKVHGWRPFWEELVQALDPTGEANAYKVLELNSTATQSQITSKYRKLARQWHPDRHKDEASKAEAQEKFIEIQQAYEILSKRKARQAKTNAKSNDD